MDSESLDKALKLAIAGDAIATDMAQVNKQTCFIGGGDRRIWDAYYHRNAGKIKAAPERF